MLSIAWSTCPWVHPHDAGQLTGAVRVLARGY